MKAELQNSCLNVQVSAWASYFETEHPRPVNLLTWLHSPKYAPQVEAIRAAGTKAERDKLKAQLPAITPSGLFSKREEAGLIRHSGLLQVDIDFKENTHITNYPELKAQLARLQNIAFLGLSVSGTGFWGLVPILYPEKHKAHFMALKSALLKIGILIDEKPGNVASLRGYSWDESAHFNHSAKPFALLEEARPERYERKAATPRPQSTEAEKVEAILQQAEAARVDITSGYGAWFSIGCALANEFGEAGREYFHRISQWHPEYRAGQTDTQFTACLKQRYRYTLGTFFELAQQQGLIWKNRFQDSAHAPKAASKPVQRTENAIPAPREEGGNSLPEGFQWIQINGGKTLEVDGLPFTWLGPKAEAEARKRLAGYELAYLAHVNPVVTQFVDKFNLIKTT